MKIVNSKTANPMKSYKRLDNALAVVGFNIEVPKRYKIKEIYVISGQILEIRFNDICIRKAKYKQSYDNEIGISGVYKGGYPSACIPSDFSISNGQKGVTYWNSSSQNPKAYLSIWNINKQYSYSVYARNGINLKKMTIWQTILR